MKGVLVTGTAVRMDLTWQKAREFAGFVGLA